MPLLNAELSTQLDDLGGPDTLDDEAVHGLVTAAAMPGRHVSGDDLLAMIMGDDMRDTPAGARTAMADALQTLCHNIDMTLAGDDTLALPFEPTLHWEDSAMQSWCVGFMTYFFAHETRFAVAEDRLTELLLPIQVGSGLFADEPEFQPLYADQALLGSLVEQIPDSLTDIYLACRVL